MIVTPTYTATVRFKQYADAASAQANTRNSTDTLVDPTTAELLYRRRDGAPTGDEITLTHASTGVYTGTVALTRGEWRLKGGSTTQSDQCEPGVTTHIVGADGY